MVRKALEGPVVVLSPHLDDAVLSAWSAVAGMREIVVVNVFAGVPDPCPATPWDRLAGASDSQSLMLSRLAEDVDALALAGRTPVSLPFLDHQYRDAEPNPLEIEAMLSECVPAASAVHAPAGIGGHRDHVIVRDLAVDIARTAGLAVVLYAELPYAVRKGWPAWVTGADRDPHLDLELDWEPALAAAPVPSGALCARVRNLDARQAAAKRRAMKRYRTQFPLLNCGPIGLLEHPRVLPFEVEWTVDL